MSHLAADEPVPWRYAVRPGKAADSSLHCPHLPDNSRGSLPTFYTYEVHVYSITEGFEHLTTFSTGLSAPTMQWSPSAHLCIAQLCTPSRHLGWESDSGLRESSMCSAAFTWDPKTRAFLHTLEPEVSAALRKLADGCKVFGCWAPSCRYLQLHGFPVSACGHSNKHSGWLVIVNVVTGSLAAQSILHSTESSGPPVHPAVAWHPSSAGLVIQADIEVQDIASIRHAGFATGVLPAHLRLLAVGSPSDADHLVASGPQGWVLVSCRINEQDICLHKVQGMRTLEGGGDGTFNFGPSLPSFSTLWLYVSPPAELQCCQHDSGGSEQPFSHARHCLCNARVSPSGRLFCPSPCSLRVIEVHTRQRHWGARGNQPLLLGEVEGDLPAQLQRPQRSLSEPVCVCCAVWLPSGLGLLVSTYGGITPKGYMPPALHLIWYA